jgi:uncharacterized damage-inducible protein DinB
MSAADLYLEDVRIQFRKLKALAEDAVAQVTDDELVAVLDAESNSVAVIMKHIAGNLRSRFTDFLTTDGEKPWRDRESEFAERSPSRKEMLSKWERGWSILFQALAPLTDRHLAGSVTIRGIVMTVGEALERSLAHTSYHVGQITFAGKMLRREEWKYLSIPPGQTAAYNANPTLERARVPSAQKTKRASPGSPAKAAAKTARKPARKPATRKTASKARTKKKARR